MTVLTDIVSNDIVSDLWKNLATISHKTLNSKATAENLLNFIGEILPNIEQIKKSGVELPPPRQFQLDRCSELLRSGVELSHQALATSRWNVYRNFQLVKKMENLEETVTKYLQAPLQAELLADVNQIKVDMEERFDRLDASNRRMERFIEGMKIGVGGGSGSGGWIEEVVRSSEDDEGSFGNFSLSFGLEFGKNKVVEMVVGRKDFCVVGICGIGGSGKTTLAREVCRDEQLRSHFRERILFLTVSQSPNVEQLRAKIWGHIMGSGSMNTNFVVPQWMPQYGYDGGSQAQILIILDDVWTLPVLEQLVFRIPCVRFIVVSRFHFSVFNATYLVEPLGEDDALSLFCHHAFGQKSIPSTVNQNLVKQVVAECGKLPLALKVIGASLRDQNEMFWLSVKTKLSQGLSIGESYEHNLIDRMAISTNYLPEKIKECFLDLCSFPEDKKIPLEILINMWVEIHDIHETEAYAIVVELSNKNLITLVKEARAGGMYSSCFEISITQHDILRDVALNLNNDRNVNQRRRLVMPKRDDDDGQLPREWLRYEDQPFEARIVSIQTGEMRKCDWCNFEFPKAEVLIINFTSSEYFLPPFINRMPNLRALIVINHSTSYARLHNISVLKSLTKLRSLWLEKVSIPQLSGIVMESLRKLFIVLCMINRSLEGKDSNLADIFPNISELTLDHCEDLTEFPSSLCKIQSLKNLSLTNCHNLTRLPIELGSLNSLQILRLYACPDLRTLPPTICQMTRLKYIDISQCVNLTSFPEAIGKLVSLEKIDMRECPMITNIPKSALSLHSLQLVICDEEVSSTWKEIGKAKPNLNVQVAEMQYDLDWLDTD